MLLFIFFFSLLSHGAPCGKFTVFSFSFSIAASWIGAGQITCLAINQVCWWASAAERAPAYKWLNIKDIWAFFLLPADLFVSYNNGMKGELHGEGWDKRGRGEVRRWLDQGWGGWGRRLAASASVFFYKQDNIQEKTTQETNHIWASRWWRRLGWKCLIKLWELAEERKQVGGKHINVIEAALRHRGLH